MRRPPPLSHLPAYPVVGGAAVLAVAVSLAGWSKTVDVSPLVSGAEIRAGEVWRLVTTALPHGNALHLFFNVSWLWALGTVIEEQFGHLKTFALIILLAAGSTAAEYAILEGGIGLSGVVYGLFGMLWVLGRRDPRFAGAVDKNTATIFVFWFFLCIVLTFTGALLIANIAHGMGAVLGALLGLSIGAKNGRAAYAALLSVVTATCLTAGTVGRPYVNLSADRGKEEAYLGYLALKEGRNQEAVKWLRYALRLQEDSAGTWYNLGLAYDGVGRKSEAVAAHKRAVELAPGDKQFRNALEATQTQADGGVATPIPNSKAPVPQ